MTFSIVKESTKIPSGRAFGSPFHPGFELGYDHFFGKNIRHQFLYSIKVGYYFHKAIHHGVTIKPAISYFYVTNNNLYFGSELNLGYLHAFTDETLFKQNENGDYKKITNWGKPKFMPTIAFSSGYQFHKEDKEYLDLFIKYEFGLETPFSKGIGIPIFPHSFIHLGTRWYGFQ